MAGHGYINVTVGFDVITHLGARPDQRRVRVTFSGDTTQDSVDSNHVMILDNAMGTLRTQRRLPARYHGQRVISARAAHGPNCPPACRVD